MALKTGTLIVSRGNYEIMKKKEIDEYYSLLLPLYEKFGYRPALRGQKSADVHGFTIQMYVGLGFFPSADKALECHQSAEYKETVKIREKFMSDYQLTLFAKPDNAFGDNLEDGYVSAGKNYEETKTFIIYRNNMDFTKMNQFNHILSGINDVMLKHSYQPFYFGKKIKDIEGKNTVQDYIGVGFYPDINKARNCFLDGEYHLLSDKRELFVSEYETAIYGPAS